MQLPTYQDIAVALQQMNASLEPSEAHGMLCALICVGDKINDASWTNKIFGQAKPTDKGISECRALLLQLFKYSFHQLTTMAFDFRLLLPDDNEDLTVRSECLGLWCHGFITGLSAAEIGLEQAHSQEIKDALLHFTGIANINYDNIEITDEDEKCYMEVSEYVRMAVLMIYTEFAGAIGITTVSANNDGTIVH